jgi:hypothetical protein
MRYYTDYSVTGNRPAHFTGVNASCVPNQTSAAYNNKGLELNKRYDGILLKSNDTIYVWAWQPANTPLLIVLDSKTTTADFDLYMSSTNYMPDDSNYDSRGYSSSPREAIDVPPVGWPGRALFIGIHSYGPTSPGSGQFSINVMAQDWGQRMALNVCPVQFTPTTDQRSKMSALLRAGAINLLAGSNGNQFINRFSILTSQASCAGSCDVCFYDSVPDPVHLSGGPLAGHVCGLVHVPKSFWDQPLTDSGRLGMFHEWGHACYGLPDEYTGPPSGDASNTICGHSVMNNGGHNRMFCSHANCLDGHTSDFTACNSNTSNWAGFVEPRIFWGTKYGSANVSATPSNFTNNVSLSNLIQVF